MINRIEIMQQWVWSEAESREWAHNDDDDQCHISNNMKIYVFRT